MPAPPPSPPTGPRVLVLGASGRAICGVRAHALALNDGLQAQGATVHSCWWERPPGAGLAEIRRSLAAYASTVRVDGRRFEPDWILVHYSVWDWSWGPPLLVPALVRIMGAAKAPSIAFVHEHGLPLTPRVTRQAALAASQRAALAGVLWRSRAALLTTEQRLADLRGRRELPRRPLGFAPISSSSGTGRARPDRAGRRARIGVLGYSTGGYPCDAVAGAVRALVQDGVDVALVLVGWPGPDSDAGRRWFHAAGRAGCADRLVFTGVLDDAGLAEALSGLDLMVFPDPGGPAARKTTLAAGLAYGLPVVALPGPEGWDRLVEAGAVVLTGAATAADLAPAIGDLLADDDARRAAGARARAFYDAEMAPAVVADRILGFVGGLSPVPTAAR